MQEELQRSVARAYVSMIKAMREKRLKQAGEDGAKERYCSFSYPDQMAIAEAIIREPCARPEILMNIATGRVIMAG